jgi:plasmid replication initiation protein
VSSRHALLDRSLEALPLFRLSDSADETAVSYETEHGGRWRVLPAPGDRIPGTFDQDVYVELMHRYRDAGFPGDGTITFTLHAFLRSMGRRVDGRTYEQLRSALARLGRTVLESVGAYRSAGVVAEPSSARFTLLTSVFIERRREAERDQLPLFDVINAAEPGVARVTISPVLRANLAAGHTVALSVARYFALPSPVAKRLYRLLVLAREDGLDAWRVPLDRLAEQMPLVQRYPSHLQRVLGPAHEMLVGAGLVRSAAIVLGGGERVVEYVLARRAVAAAG